MLFRLVIEHRDIFRLLGPYMRPGFSIKIGMKPFWAKGPIFNCAITRDGLFSKKNVVRLWGVADGADTLEEAISKTVASAKRQP